MNYIVIFFAKYVVFVLPLIVAIVFLVIEKKEKIAFLKFSVIMAPVSYALAYVAGYLWYNPRPFVVEQIVPLIYHVNDNGFPSGHTLFAGVFAMSLFFVHRKTSIALLVLTIIIGVSRVVADVHHLMDIVGSILIVVIGALIAYSFDRRLFKARLS